MALIPKAMRGGRLLALALVLAMAGCASTRDTKSPYIPPPTDLARERWESDLQRIREEPELSLPRTEYLLGQGDRIAIAVVGRPDLLGLPEESPDNRARFTLNESPFIVLPYLGGIRVHGKTPDQLREDLTAAYTRIVKDPVVFVTVEEYQWNQAAVLGSVKMPGRYPLDPGDTLLDVIFKAGGLSLGGRTGELPPARVLKIYREETPQRQSLDVPLEELLERIRETGTVTPREEILLPLDNFLLGGDLAFNLTIQPGDIVYIPPAGTVTVHGAVFRPRVVFLGPGIRTLAQVFTEVGGLQFRAASRIEIVRPNLDGTSRSIYVNARDIMKREAPDVMVEDNDQIFVYTHPVRNTLSVIGSIFRTTASAGVNATYNPVP